ncbi:dicarboxylic amino acid permease [Aureobasidium pullulans]|nr:dicarboxylic amino acid permease [Aureobasidium pullulans]
MDARTNRTTTIPATTQNKYYRHHQRMQDHSNTSPAYEMDSKQPEGAQISQIPSVRQGEWDNPDQAGPHNALHKGLQSRHVAMIALGGSLGTGLLIGTQVDRSRSTYVRVLTSFLSGSAFVKTGPAGVLIDYSIVGICVFMVMAALGEMVSYAPSARGFGGYATRFVDPCLGFATGWVYLFKYLLATPNQLVGATLIMKIVLIERLIIEIQYWVGDSVSPAVFITVVLVLIMIINYTSIRAFGEFEFWLSSLKVIILLGVIILLLVIACGGGPSHQATGFRYWAQPGAFAEYKTDGATGRFVGLWTSMITAVYAFGGTELVAVTVGEAKNPRIVMPKAIKMTFFRICFFYVVSVFLLGLTIPYNSSQLVFATKSSTSAAASPFLVAVKLAKIQGLDHLLNGCLLVFVLSAANSDLYTSSRTLYGLALDGKAPKVFAWTNKRGVPIPALVNSSAFCLLAYMAVDTAAKLVFSYFLSVVSVFGLLTWVSILVSHICFCRAIKIQKISPESLAFRAPLRHYGSIGALLFLSLLIVTNGLNSFIGEFDYKTFITSYIGIPTYLCLIFGYKFTQKSQRIRSYEADLISGVPSETVEEERTRLVERRKQRLLEMGGIRKKLTKAYYFYFQWLF